MDIDFLFSIIILIFSVVIHEVAHGYAANALGDPTARYQGRLTLNPVKHLDPVGSLIIPTVAYLLGGFIFGWAKPVPYNPYNLRNQKWGEVAVAAAGPLSNLAIAVLFGLLLRFGLVATIFGTASVPIVYSIVFINIILAVFNMIPIPPLDGSKVLFGSLPHPISDIRFKLEPYAFILIFAVVFLFSGFVLPVVDFISRLIIGT